MTHIAIYHIIDEFFSIRCLPAASPQQGRPPSHSSATCLLFSVADNATLESRRPSLGCCHKYFAVLQSTAFSGLFQRASSVSQERFVSQSARSSSSSTRRYNDKGDADALSRHVLIAYCLPPIGHWQVSFSRPSLLRRQALTSTNKHRAENGI